MPTIHRHGHTGTQMKAKCNDCNTWWNHTRRTWECGGCGSNDYFKPTSCHVCRTGPSSAPPIHSHSGTGTEPSGTTVVRAQCTACDRYSLGLLSSWRCMSCPGTIYVRPSDCRICFPYTPRQPIGMDPTSGQVLYASRDGQVEWNDTRLASVFDELRVVDEEAGRRMRRDAVRYYPFELGPHDRRPDDRRPDPYKEEPDQ